MTKHALENPTHSQAADVTEPLLARARGGDEDAYRELTDRYRRELQLHIYRIVGSTQDAEDLLQETLLAAWRGLEQFEERASVRTWLYRIATNRSLDALRASRRRQEEEWMTRLPDPTRFNEPLWLDPYPDTLLDGIADDAPGPEARYETREAVALAFVAGLQHLPPQQRAVLVLRDVLGYRAAEAADLLGTTDAAVNNLLRQRRGAARHATAGGTDARQRPARVRVLRHGARNRPCARLCPLRANACGSRDLGDYVVL